VSVNSPPAKSDEWNVYDVIVLGRSVDKVIGAEGVTQLEDYVKNGGGTVVFSRGRAFTDKGPRTDLEPVTWGDATQNMRPQATREGQALAPSERSPRSQETRRGADHRCTRHR
jgi:hypothetical protein